MDCKNCQTSLDEQLNFCPLCGAKIIRHRLTLKNIWSDVSAQFLNIDNTLYRTFIHLFTSPEKVINGFIEGTRKKYVNVIQYFALSLTLLGLQVFIMNTFFKEALDVNSDFFDSLNATASAQKNNPLKSFFNLDLFNNYLSLYYTLSIPFSAISTWIAYRIAGKKQFNFTEHIVINLYYYAQSVIITALVTIILLCFGLNYMIITSITSIFVLIYFFYVLKRVFKTIFLETVAYFLLTMVALGFVFIILLIIALIIGVIIGYLLKKLGFI